MRKRGGKGIKRIVFGAASLFPATALAQNIPTGDVNTNLDPSAAPPQASRPAPTSQGANGGRQAVPQGGDTQPNVIVVGPDGKITSSNAQEPAENGYYVSGGQPVQTTDSFEMHAGPIPELHVVRTGDTLWDISGFYFANPWEWPKVWSYNPQITNPHWIYPGDLVRLLPRGVFVSSNPEPENQQQQVQKQPDVVPPPARRTDVGIKQTAFVEKKDLDESVVIDGSVDEKELLGDGDSVYLSYPSGKPPQVGKRYSIYIPGSEVTAGYQKFGSYVKVIGTVEIVSVKEKKRARGVIVQANQEIERGAKVGPLVKQFKNVPPVPPKVDAQGPIIGMLTRDQLIGDGEIVFVALGKSSGVEVGNRMYVVRRGDAKPDIMSPGAGKDDRRFPARALGEVVIVEVGEKVSIGLVTLSVQEMSVGDLVMMQAAK
ncbi:MAG: LysM peptidoglycan-binding domain-containing protein [Kofleriaceae bacterium]